VVSWPDETMAVVSTVEFCVSMCRYIIGLSARWPPAEALGINTAIKIRWTDRPSDRAWSGYGDSPPIKPSIHPLAYPQPSHSWVVQ